MHFPLTTFDHSTCKSFFVFLALSRRAGVRPFLLLFKRWSNTVTFLYNRPHSMPPFYFKMKIVFSDSCKNVQSIWLHTSGVFPNIHRYMGEGDWRFINLGWLHNAIIPTKTIIYLEFTQDYKIMMTENVLQSITLCTYRHKNQFSLLKSCTLVSSCFVVEAYVIHKGVSIARALPWGCTMIL